MYINEICKMTGLTKKAIEYYEKQGLLLPTILENGYRKYEDKELLILKEIALLRKMGISISEIKNILFSNDKSAALKICRSKMTKQMALLDIQQRCMDHLLKNGYDIDEATQYTAEQLDGNNMIRERLKEAFPGNYGLFLEFHFGRFLNERVDTPEKEAAFGRILEFFDNLADIPFPKEIETYMAENSVWNNDIMQNIEKGTNAAIDDIDTFMKTKREIIEMYLEYCKSDKYKESIGYKIKTMMIDFQKEIGYSEVFIESMKTLSFDYSLYLEKLQKSNEQFLSEYPEAADILGFY